MKLKTENVVMENEIKIKSKLNQNISMSASIAVSTQYKNRIKQSYWIEK